MHWISEIFNYLSILGFIGYVFYAIQHALHEPHAFASWVAVFIGFYLIHHGGSWFLRTSASLLKLNTVRLDRFATFLGSLPEKIANALSQPPESPVDRVAYDLNRKEMSRRAIYTVVLLGLSVSGYVFYKGSSIPSVDNAKIEKLVPPVASLPFDKKWQAPDAPANIGGPAVDVPAPKPVAPPSIPVIKAKPKKSSARNMTDPWNFPRF